MSTPDRLIAIVSALVLVHVVGAQIACAEIDGQRDAQADKWPPDWLEGLWKNDSATITYEGLPTNKTFVFASHYIFTSGYRFSIFEGRRIKATPMIGQTQRGGVLHCLFKMTNNRAAMRAEFTGHAQRAEFVSYQVSTSNDRRYKLKRKLSRVSSDEDIITVVKVALEKEFYSPHSTSARKIIENWIAEREQSLEQNSFKP